MITSDVFLWRGAPFYKRFGLNPVGEAGFMRNAIVPLIFTLTALWSVII